MTIQITNTDRNYRISTSKNFRSKGETEKLTENFTRVPNAIIFDTSLSDPLFRTLIALLSYQYGDDGKSFPSQIGVAKRLGKTRQTINQHIAQLKELGFIKAKRRGYSASCEYSFSFCQKNPTNEPSQCQDNLTSNVNNPLLHVSPASDSNKTNKKTNQEIGEKYDCKQGIKNMDRVRKNLTKKGILKRNHELYEK